MDQLAPDHQQRLRWGVAEATNALAALSAMRAQGRFQFRDGVAECYRLVGVGAALLAHEPRDHIACIAAGSTIRVAESLRDQNERNTDALAQSWAAGMISYIDYTCWTLRLRTPPKLAAVISQLLERHTAEYLAAEPDFHPDLLVDLSYALVDAATSIGPQSTRKIVQSIFDELNSIPVAPLAALFEIDPVWDRRATLTNYSVPRRAATKKQSPPSDYNQRLDRLLDRRAALAVRGVDADRLELLESRIARIKRWAIAENQDLADPPF